MKIVTCDHCAHAVPHSYNRDGEPEMVRYLCTNHESAYLKEMTSDDFCSRGVPKKEGFVETMQ